MKKILTILGILLSSFVYGQKFSYEVLYEGSNGDSLTKTDGTFNITRTHKSKFGFDKGVIRIKTNNFTLKTKVVFTIVGEGEDTYLLIGTGMKNPVVTLIKGELQMVEFLLNDKPIYYIQMVPQKKGS